MRRLEVIFSAKAESDLEAIEAWLLLEGASQRTVDDYVERLVERCLQIGDAPGAGRPR